MQVIIKGGLLYFLIKIVAPFVLTFSNSREYLMICPWLQLQCLSTTKGSNTIDLVFGCVLARALRHHFDTVGKKV